MFKNIHPFFVVLALGLVALLSGYAVVLLVEVSLPVQIFHTKPTNILRCDSSNQDDIMCHSGHCHEISGEREVKEVNARRT